MTPILQFCTTLFFCLYKSYLINSGFALCYPHHFISVWGSSDTKQCSWCLLLTQLKVILLIRTFSLGFIVWVNSVGCHQREKERERVRVSVWERERDDDRGRGQGETGCRRPNPVSTGQENNSCDLVTHTYTYTHTQTSGWGPDLPLTEGGALLLF